MVGCERNVGRSGNPVRFSTSRGYRPASRSLRLEDLESRWLLALDTIPFGSLIERNAMPQATISVGGEIDMSALQLDAGQKLSILAQASGGLAPMVSVTGPIGGLGSDGAAVNQTALMQNLDISLAGTYTISVTGTGGTTGSYVLTTLINADVELEAYGGAANDLPAAAVPIGSSSIGWGAVGVDRLAMLGTATATNPLDYVSFSLSDGQQSTVALGGNAEGMVLDLLDASGSTVLASGVTAENVRQLIPRFTDTTTDGIATTYLARVSQGTAASGTEWTVLVTRGTDFEAEPNLSFVEAQPTRDVLGRVTTESFSGTVLQSNFTGMNSNSTSCGCEPPDTHGAVGPNHFVEVVNTAITIYNKNGTIAQGPTEFQSFFQPSILAGEQFDFDPVIAYDNLANRWVLGVLIAASSSSAESDLLYAISNTSDPTQGFSEQHRINFGGVSPGLFADYPKIGFNADAHVFSLNMFSTSAYEYVDILSIDKSTVLDQNPATFSHHITSRPDTSFTMAVASMHESAPGDPMWLVEESGYGGTRTNVRVVKMANPTSATPTYTEYLIPVPSYSSGDLPNAPQPGGSFNTNDARMLNAESRGTRLVSTQSVSVSGKSLVRWYEFDTSGGVPTLTQQGNIDPGPGISTFFPSIAINDRGDLGITYMQSSSSQFVSMYVTGQAFGAVPGTLSAPALVKSGNESYPGGRGGDYSGVTVDPVDDSFWAVNEVSLTGSPNPLWSTWAGNFTVSPLSDNDWYQIPVSAGDSLDLRTRTPFDAPLAILNTLDPKLELYAPDETLVAMDDNSGGDGHNSRILHIATQGGNYRVHILGANDSDGAYQLSVAGSTAADPSPFVAGMSPVDGMKLAVFPTALTLEFSETMLLSSLSPADVRIGGLAATSLTVVDGRTLTFGVDPAANIGDGTYAVLLSAGLARDLQDQGNLGFTGSFELDTTGPIVTATLWNGGSFPGDATLSPGGLTFRATMNEDLFTLSSARRGLRTPGVDDVTLTELVTNQTVAATGVAYDPATYSFTATFGSLGEGNYRLRLISGNGAFEDSVGNDMDGEPSGSGDGTPTGNGVNGGDYVLDFLVDRNSVPVGVSPFVRTGLLGSLAAASIGNLGFMNFAGDQDPFAFDAEAGETMAFRVLPGNSASRLSITYQGTTVTATNPGDPVTLSLQGVVTTGTDTVVVGGDVASNYTLDLYRNVDVTAQGIEGGPIALDPSAISFGSGRRFAAVGTARGSSGNLQWSQSSNPSQFIDISATGTPLNLGDDTEATIVTTVGNAFFPAGSTTVANNGGILAGGGRDLSTANSALPSSSFAAALLPLWDDIDSDTGNVYWKEQLVSGIRTLIVQWENRPRFSNIGNSTFQIQLFETGPVVARFAYEDVDFGDPLYNFGASATVGYQASASSALEFSRDTASLENGDVLDLLSLAPNTDVDEFTVDLTASAGRKIDVVLNGQGTSFTSTLLELVDPLDVVVATGVTNPLGTAGQGFDLAILDHFVATPGVYRVRLSAGVTGNYQVTVSERLRLDIEPNNLATQPLRLLNTTQGALGYLGGSQRQFVRSNNPGAFVDISTTGTPLNLGDDDEATITTTVGNLIFPVGQVTVGNNGGILGGAGLGLDFTNATLPNGGLGQALLPFWDDFDGTAGNVYWQEQLVGGIRTLIVQWENRPHYSNVGSATFQLQLFESGPIAARYAYEDIDFGNATYNFGASATVGFQATASDATQYSFNTASLANGDVLDLLLSDTDAYQLALNAGDRVTLFTDTPFDSAGHSPLNDLDAQLTIRDPANGLVAANMDSAGDGNNAWLTFVAPVAGTYLVQVQSETGTGEYYLAAGINSVTGDFDLDGTLDCDDIDGLSRAIAGGLDPLRYDVTADNQVDAADLNEWVLNLKQTLFGDANLDFAVDGSDFSIWNANKFTSGTAWCTGDFNADGSTDGSDFGIWNLNKFQAADGGSNSGSMVGEPQPGTIRSMDARAIAFAQLGQEARQNFFARRVVMQRRFT